MRLFSLYQKATAISIIVFLAALMLVSPRAGHAQSGNLWRIDYFPNTEWSGAPVHTDYDNVIAMNWRNTAPGPFMPTENWTARMTSQVFFYAGLYRFTLIADDEFVLRIDGMDYFDTRDQTQSGKAFVLDIPLTQGVHAVQVDFRQFTGQAYLRVDWHFVKGGLQPPEGTVDVVSIVTRYGDFTRCIQQGLHQSHCFEADGTWESPTLGMIQMEPPIIVWENCAADAVQTRRLPTDGPVRTAQCSKSEAGWFVREGVGR